MIETEWFEGHSLNEHNQRQTVLPLVAWALTVIVLVFAVILATKAYALQLTSDGCAEMAIWSRDIVWSREMGADKEKVRSYLVSKQTETLHFQIILKTFDLLWASEESQPAIAERVLRECYGRRGNYGTDA